MTTPYRIIKGSCHCGNLAIEVRLTADRAYEPRACDCNFCTMHGASHISDPNGQLRIRIKDESAPGRYRQGSGGADMLFCSNCGGLAGPCYKEGQKLFGVVNTRTFSEVFGAETAVCAKHLRPDENTERWMRLGFGGMQISKFTAWQDVRICMEKSNMQLVRCLVFLGAIVSM